MTAGDNVERPSINIIHSRHKMVRLGRALVLAAACLPLASALGIKGPKVLVQGGKDEQFS
jgi:hypothetical protein